MWVTKQLLAPVTSLVFYIFFFSTIKVSGDQLLFGYPHSSKYRLLCSAQEKNNNTGLGQDVSE